MFELNDEILSQIMFYIENQKDKFYIHLETGKIYSASSENDVSEMILLPEWSPSNGFQLMEGFVETLNNPIYRELLREILASRKGIFRKFKDALNERSDIRSLWFVYKEKNIKKHIFDWYNLTREAKGLEIMESQFDEEEPPVTADFTIEYDDGSCEELFKEWDKRVFNEFFSQEERALADFMYKKSRLKSSKEQEEHIYLKAVGPDNQVVGFCWINDEVLGEDGLISEVKQLFVLPEFRGIGIAKELLHKVVVDSYNRGADYVLLNQPVHSEFLNRMTEVEGFKVINTVKIRDFTGPDPLSL